MRLIDADKLKTTKGMFIYQTEDADVIAMEAYRWELIEREAPTVEAIPIKWLRTWFTKKASLIGMTLMGEIESDWEKENEHKESD